MKFLLLFLCVGLAHGFLFWGSRTNRRLQGVRTTAADIRNMREAIRVTPLIEIEADTFNGECVYNQRDKRSRIERSGYDLDLWSALTCTFAVVTQGRQYARLYSPGRSVGGVSLQTLYLPLYGHNTASFMTVPRTFSPTFFITATLTGCDVFVASSGTGSDVSCPLVVIHTNACGDMTSDINHLEAIAVLSTDLCRGHQYQLKYRLASEDHRSIIERGRYHYTTQYYNPDLRGIFFGYTEGGGSVARRQPWAFCRKNGSSASVFCYTNSDL